MSKSLQISSKQSQHESNKKCAPATENYHHYENHSCQQQYYQHRHQYKLQQHSSADLASDGGSQQRLNSTKAAPTVNAADNDEYYNNPSVLNHRNCTSIDSMYVDALSEVKARNWIEWLVHNRN